MIIKIRLVKEIEYDTDKKIVLSVRDITEPLKEEVKEDTEPVILLDKNKLVFNSSAISFIGLSPGNKICISYKTINSDIFPIIEQVDNTSDGNKLTKGLTVSFRGSRYEALSIFGIKFYLKKIDELIVLTSEDKVKRIDDSELEEIDETIIPSEEELIKDQADKIDFDFNF